MTRITFRFGFGIVSVLALSVLSIPWAAAADNAKPGADAAMMELMKPGKEHQAMAKTVGTWDATVKAWMDPAAAPMESKGTDTVTAILDGHFFRHDFSGQMMGMPFTGVGIDGYDRVRNLYTASWLDSMSTGMLFQTGTSSDGGKTITFEGDCGDCQAPGKTIKARSKVTFASDDSYQYEMFQTRDGKEAKVLEITYTRAKK